MMSDRLVERAYRLPSYDLSNIKLVHPIYVCKTLSDYLGVACWMDQNDTKYFLISSGSSGYYFEVRTNTELFALVWS